MDESRLPESGCLPHSENSSYADSKCNALTCDEERTWTTKVSGAGTNKCSSTPPDEEEPSLRDALRSWAIVSNTPPIHLTSLLQILRRAFLDLPSDAGTLLGAASHRTAITTKGRSDETGPGLVKQSQGPFRRLYAPQESSECSGNDCVNSDDKCQAPSASSPSPAVVNHERLTPTTPSSVPTSDLNAATWSSIPTKASDPRSPLEANTSGMQYFKLEEPTCEEPANNLEGDRRSPPHEYTCEFCGKAFPKNWRLNAHVKTVHKKLGRFECEICSKTLANKRKLKKHIDSVHNNIRNWTCEICAKSFSDKTSLSVHIDCVHKHLRKFPCDICGHSFKRRETLKDHVLNMHENLRNFPCDICGDSFKHGEALKKHVDGVHKNLRNFPCDICDHSFRQKTDLNRHINIVHQKLRKFSCAICGRTFTRNSTLKTHLERLHPDSLFSSG